MKLSTKSSRRLLPVLVIAAFASQASSIAATKSDIKNTSVSIDTKGFAKTIKREVEKATPFDPEEPIIFYSGQPESLIFHFDGEKTDMGDNDFMKRHLMVFPLPEFQAIYNRDKRKSKQFKEDVATLKKIIATKSTRGIEDIPVFPSSDGSQFFHNQERALNFKTGSGVSFITAYGNGDGPLTNDSQFYCFQGITRNGRYWVSFFTPVKTRGMPKAEIQKPGIAYVGKLARNTFTPDLDSLDKMIQTLDVH